MTMDKIYPPDYPRFEEFFRAQAYRLSPYCLSSILVWSNELYEPYAAVEDGFFVVGYEIPVHQIDRHLLLPIAPGREASPVQLVEIARRLGFAAYALVPEEYLERQGRDAVERLFEIVELEGHADYIYRAEDLGGLEGRAYAKKRNLIRQFERDFLVPGRVAIEKITPAIAAECGAFLDEWCVENGCDEAGKEELGREKIAAEKAIKNIDLLKLSGILVRIDGRLSAFGIGARLTDDMGVLLFEKAFAHHKGLYQFLDRECARRLFLSCLFVNKEGDLGEPGLEKAKKSYFPILRMKSYRLNLRKEPSILSSL